MDAEGQTLWDATLLRAGEHDRAVVDAHNNVIEPEVAAYWIDWNKFKASLKDLDDKIHDTLSYVSDSDVQAKDSELNVLIAQFNDLAPRIQARKLSLDESALIAALAKQKLGQKLSDDEIATIAKYTAEGEKPLIQDSPVKPSIPQAPIYPAAPPGLWDTIPTWAKIGGAVVGVAIVVGAVRR